MDQETLYKRHHRRCAIVTTATTTPSSELEKRQDDEWGGGGGEGDDPLLLLSKPAGWFVQLVAIQVELITGRLLSLSSPFVNILFESYAVPSRIARCSTAALRRLACGLLGALYACAALLTTMAIAALLGIALVRLWVEEPVAARQPAHFDYTLAHPCATVSFKGTGPKGRPVPSGHTAKLSLVLLMPESDYNRRVGVFQVTAEAISSTGVIIATSSQPCLLKFRSLSVKLMRTFVMGIPLLMGMSTESQKLVIELLSYKERKLKTEVIRVRLKPRAGTSDLPQIYSAELLLSSQLPWMKKVVYNWKWTFYVWMSLYTYIMLLTITLCCCKPVLVLQRHRTCHQIEEPTEVRKESRYSFRGEGDISDGLADALRKWRDKRRSKRKAHHVHRPELVESSASTIGGGERSEVIEGSWDSAASESSECAS